MTSTVDKREERSDLSRRTVLRAGAHAAWAVPAISIVTAAPAFAVSGSNACPKLKLKAHGTQFKGHTGRVVFKVTNKNPGVEPVSITVSASNVGPNATLTLRKKPFSVNQSSGSSWTVTGPAKPGDTTVVLYFKADIPKSGPGGTLSGVLSDGNGNTCAQTAYSFAY